MAVPLGAYLQRVFGGGRQVALERPLGSVERGLYRLLRVDAAEDQTWREYAACMVVFSAVCTLTAYALLRVQSIHPLNPAPLPRHAVGRLVQHRRVVRDQHQLAVLRGRDEPLVLLADRGHRLQSLLSMAVGLAVGIAVIRGFVRRGGGAGLGSFWVDLVRGLLYVILPICALGALFFVGQGAAQGITGDAIGPVASWEPIKTLGSVGGGFFNVNSAMPYENPTPLSSFVQALLIVLGPAALLHTFGRMTGNRRHGWTLYGVTVALFCVGALALRRPSTG